MTPERRSAELVRGLLAVALLVALVAGVPILLVQHVGWPLPASVPDLGRALDQIDRRGISDATVVKVIAIVVWLAWARFTASIAVEVVALIRHRPSLPRRSLGGSQRAAAGLVAAAAALLGLLGGMTGAGASAVPQSGGPRVTEWAGSAQRAVEPATRLWLVERHDSLWGIAEQALGDGMRWREIVELNLGREVAAGVVFDQYTESIQPGWQLAIPVDDAVADDPAAGNDIATVLVEPGDTLASLAGEIYGSGGEWRTLWDANAHRLFGDQQFDDPNLILPGWQLEVPEDASRPAVVDGQHDRRVDAAEAEPLAVVGVAGETTAPEPPVCQVEPAIADESGLGPAGAAATGGTPNGGPVVEATGSNRTDLVPDRPAPSGDVLGESDRPAIPGMALGVGATLLGTGAIGVLTSLRRRRLRSAGRDVRELRPEPPGARLEQLLRAVTADERLARVDVVVRSAVTHLAATSQPARLIAVVAAEDGSVGLHLDGAAPLPPPSFLADGPSHWTLPADVTVAALAGGPRFAAFPCPALAQIGRQGTADVFVDLEAVGLLVVSPGDPRSVDVVRAVAGSLAFSPLGEHVRLLVVGDDHAPRRDSVGVEAMPDLDAAIDRAAELVGPILGVLPDHDTTAGLRLRSAGETWDPVVVVVTGEVPRALCAELPSLTDPPGRGLAIVTTSAVPGARWRILPSSSQGQWQLEPLGLEFEPSSLPSETSDTLVRLVDEAREPLVVLEAARPMERPAVPVAAERERFVEPPWAVMVRMLGPLDVVDRDGAAAHFERAKAVELVAWLVEHRESATRSGARSALWEQPIQDSTFANVVSDARRGLANLVVPPAGEEWLGRTLSEHLPLHRLIVSDAALLTARRRWATGRAAIDAAPVLRAGLELVRDAPFTGSGVLWADSEGVTSNLLLLVVGAATDLAECYLELGQPDEVFWATAKGLCALPGHEELIALRMRVHAEAGDLAGVRTEWASYERVLAADPWGDAAPSPKLVELRRQLLSPAAAL